MLYIYVIQNFVFSLNFKKPPNNQNNLYLQKINKKAYHYV